MSKNGNWVKVTDLSTLKVNDKVKYYYTMYNKKYWMGDDSINPEDDQDSDKSDRIVRDIKPGEINVYTSDYDILMSNLIEDKWEGVYKWVGNEKETPSKVTPPKVTKPKSEPAVVTPEVVEPKPSKKIATIYIYESGDRYDWVIRFPIKVGHCFSSDKYYTKRNDALRAAKNVCEQMGIKYTVSES